MVYNGPIQAPIAAGDQLAELVINLDGLPEKRVPLIAEADVPEGGFATRLRTAATVLWTKFGPQSSEAPEEA